MECYKLIIQKNSRFVNYTFSAKDEDDKNAKLKAWKSENITPYDCVKLLFLGTLEQHEELIYKQICLD
jgi:putative IMPACT (imprinted ancient) family translation regulator